MAKMTVSYQLTETGRKADLAAGGNGRAERTIEIDLTPDLITAANVDGEGRATYRLSPPPGAFNPISMYPGKAVYDEVLSAEKAAAEVLRAAADEVKAESAAAARRIAEKEAEKARYDADVSALRSALAAGTLDCTGVMVMVPQSSRRYYDHQLPVDVKALVNETEKRQRQVKREAEEAEEARKAADAARLAAERDEWILAHGSDRLKKGLAAGMIDRMTGAYRSERIKIDLGPDWKSWDAVAGDNDSDRLNPREDELDALLETRKLWPDEELEVRLRSVRRDTDEEDLEPGPWCPVLMMRLPWEREKWAVRYLDVKPSK